MTDKHGRAHQLESIARAFAVKCTQTELGRGASSIASTCRCPMRARARVCRYLTAGKSIRRTRTDGGRRIEQTMSMRTRVERTRDVANHSAINEDDLCCTHFDALGASASAFAKVFSLHLQSGGGCCCSDSAQSLCPLSAWMIH